MQIKTLELTAERARRRLLEIIRTAGAGHTGGDLSCLNVLIALYFHTMKIGTNGKEDSERDRFILSKGHCVESLFVTLEAKGILSREVLDTLGRFGSPLGGHPTVNVPGIEISSGALGHGLSIGVGMALAARMDGKSWRTFVLMGDGEQGEGSIYEAAMAARQYKLGNLVAIIDRNHLQISGDTEDVMGIEDIRARWEAFGWDVTDMDGDRMEDIVRKLDGIGAGDRPHLLVSHTTKGRGVSFMENAVKWHHGVPSAEEYAQALAEIDARIKELEEKI